MSKSVQGHIFTKSLPEQGLSKVIDEFNSVRIFKLIQDELIDKLERYRNFENINYSSGKVSGCVYKLTKPETTEIYHTVK